jgi:phage shock protein A
MPNNLYTDDIEQLEFYYRELQKFIENHREEFVNLLEEKKRIEQKLKINGKT